MSACELKRDYTTRYCLFSIDSKDDLWMLPTATKVGQGDLIRSTTCRMGSKAEVVDGTMYILNGKNEWVSYVNKSGGGGGGGSPEDYEYIDDSEIEDLFGGGGDTPDDGGIDIDDLPEDVELISDDEIENLFG